MDVDFETELCLYSVFIVTCLSVLCWEYASLSATLSKRCKAKDAERRARQREAMRREVRFRQQLHISLPPREPGNGAARDTRSRVLGQDSMLSRSAARTETCFKNRFQH